MKIRLKPDIPCSTICTWADFSHKPQKIMISRWSKSFCFKELIGTSMNSFCIRRLIAICRKMGSIFSMGKSMKATTVIAKGNPLFFRGRNVATTKMSWSAYVISCGLTVFKTMTTARLTTTQSIIPKQPIKTQKICTLTLKIHKVCCRRVNRAFTLAYKIFDY